MALKSTVFKADLQINDFDGQRYDAHQLTIAQHPSETDERMMVRVLAFALHAEDGLSFGKGLSSDDEPDLWLKDLTGTIRLWIDVGLPDVRTLRKAAGRADNVVLYAYGRAAEIWWTENRAELERIDQLAVHRIETESSQALAALAQRTMTLICSVQDGAIEFAGDSGSAEILIHTLKPGRSTRPPAHTRHYS
jgi:uncharacterized protein YaeQ